MFAVIKTGGKQYRVQEGDVLQVEKLDAEKGERITFKEVLLIETDKEPLIGMPYIEDAVVTAEVIDNFKDKKVIVFKKKRRKQYKKKRGHRQELTRVKIEEIIPSVKVPPKKKPVEAKKRPADVEKKPAKKVAPKKVTKTEVKAKEVKTAPPKKKTDRMPAKKKSVAKERVKTSKTAKSKTTTRAKK